MQESSMESDADASAQLAVLSAKQRLGHTAASDDSVRP